jgi:hypothetical protein
MVEDDGNRNINESEINDIDRGIYCCLVAGQGHLIRQGDGHVLGTEY